MSSGLNKMPVAPAPGTPAPARRRRSTAIRVLLEAGIPQRLAWRQRFGIQLLRPAIATPAPGDGSAR